MSRAVIFDPNNYDFSQLFSTHQGGGMMFRYYGYPRQRGGALFRVLRRVLPAIIKNPFVQQFAKKAAGNVGSFLAKNAPAFSESPLGREVSGAAANLLQDIGEGNSLQKNARNMVRGMTGLGKKKVGARKSKRKPVAFIHRRSAKIVL